MIYPRSPLLIKAFLNLMLLLVKLAIECLMPGKRYFPASPLAGTKGLDLFVGSGVVSY
ncbi:hypothetical protein Mettu_0942 [Methylobacter tundripaludum SV96]|uniref:Uncharacterized protein n=1 Tax=Methylobacter tundripaludum (strain ATCC BAA-1195 / DSM 17260 / SV96) TaxID=697282 RepID=G3IRD0_METTV|nr:hypothetical protein Mettu_0942 [Methylobacter tundripaludum SV96]